MRLREVKFECLSKHSVTGWNFILSIAFVVMIVNNAAGLERNVIELEPSHLEHEDVPRVITGTVNVTAYVGDTTTLPCDVVNLGNHHVNWLKIERNSPITLTVGYHQFSRNMRFRVARVHHHHHNHHRKHQDSHESIAVRSDNNNNNNNDESSSLSTTTPTPIRVESWNFEIRKVLPEDQGLYECYIKLNPRLKTKANIYLTVKSEKEKDQNGKHGPHPYYLDNLDNPRSERLSSGSVERIDLPPNNWVKLRCNATGVISLSGRNVNHPTYDLQWYKDDNLIEQDSRRLKKWVSSYDDSNYMELDIYAVEPEDSGLYQCRRDKTILKNVFLQVLGNSGSRSRPITTTSVLLVASSCIVMLVMNLVVRAS